MFCGTQMWGDWPCPEEDTAGQSLTNMSVLRSDQAEYGAQAKERMDATMYLSCTLSRSDNIFFNFKKRSLLPAGKAASLCKGAR